MTEPETEIISYLSLGETILQIFSLTLIYWPYKEAEKHGHGEREVGQEGRGEGEVLFYS